MTELVHIRKEDFMPVMERQDAIDRYNAIVDFVKDTMKEDLDFGTIPGTDRPTLYKPGAEKLGTLFGLASRFEIIKEVEDWTGDEHDDEPFFYYKFVCRLYRGDRLAGEGYGSCNSWEKKYRYRQADLKCPTCEVEGAIIKGKAEYGGGWLCWNKKGGCGAKWPDGADVIENQERGLVPNPDIYTQTNTILKMAKKRAFIDAILITVNASEFFTQDVEDMVIDAEYRPVERKSELKQPVQSEQSQVSNGTSKQDESPPKSNESNHKTWTDFWTFVKENNINKRIVSEAQQDAGGDPARAIEMLEVKTEA